MFHFIRVRSDHNEDDTLNIIHNWFGSIDKSEYHEITFEYDAQEERRPSELSPFHWTPERHNDLIRLKEESLDYARHIWADYVFVSSHFITLFF